MQGLTLVDFVLYVLPGFIAIEIFRSFYPAKKRSDFYNVALSIVFGLVITAFVIPVDHAIPQSVLVFPKIVGMPTIRQVILLLSAGLVVGFLRVLWRGARSRISTFHRIFRKLRPKVQSVWAKTNEPETNEWAIVFISDGSVYRGFIRYYSDDPNSESQDFLLSRATRVDEKLKEVYAVTGSGVYLNTKNVVRIEYLKGKSKASAE